MYGLDLLLLGIYLEVIPGYLRSKNGPQSSQALVRNLADITVGRTVRIFRAISN